MRQINKIVVHCSDSDYPQHDNVETIRKWHTDRGFIGPDGVEGTNDDIGYHWIITQDGKIHPGRKEASIGAHVKNHNKDSIGICLTGGRKTVANALQRKALGEFLEKKCKEFKLTKMDVLAHRDLDKNKECPLFDLHEFLAGLKWH